VCECTEKYPSVSFWLVALLLAILGNDGRLFFASYYSIVCMLSETSVPVSYFLLENCTFETTWLTSYKTRFCRQRSKRFEVYPNWMNIDIIFRPHCSTTYIDVAYRYLPCTVVYRSVCHSTMQKRLNWSRCHLGWDLGRPREPYIRWEFRSPWEGEILRWKKGGLL